VQRQKRGKTQNEHQRGMEPARRLVTECQEL
jgi:hypothetical protein